MARFIVVLVLGVLVGSAAAQEASLIDILQAKGVLTKKEALRLKASQTSKMGGEQQELIELLRAKGILTENDVAQLQTPATSSTSAVTALPEITERLSRVESNQAALQVQAQAQAEQQTKAVEELKKTAVADVKKNIDWLNRFSFFGDIRVRHEGFYQDGVTARNRQRLRLRFGARLQVSEELEGGLRLVSGDPNEIAANNQTLTDVFTRKPINIDNAYITVRPSKLIGLEKPFFSITGGKFSVPFFRPRAVMGSEIIFDEDLAPEGLSEEITLFEDKGVFRSLKVIAGQWAVKEFAADRDSYMLGEQLQGTFAITPTAQLTVAAADYYFFRSDAVAQERNRNSSLTLTNSVILRDGQVVEGGDLIVPSNTNPIKRFAGGFNIVTHLTRSGRKRCRLPRMKAQRIADLYSDYLLASFGATTATGLSELLEGEISHDQVTRYLAGTQKTASDLWRTVKSFVREVQSTAGVLILDDSIEEKPYTDENDIVCWHYDHAKDRMLKGINFLTALYSSQGVSVPVGFHLVAKTQKYTDPKTQKEKRRSAGSKNTVGQELIKQAVRNRIPFRFVLFDVWFASAETMVFIKHNQHHDFICPLKTNRKVALSKADKQQGRYVRVDTLELKAQATREIYLEGVDFPLILVKQVFTNEDGSRGLRYLVSSDITLSFDDVTTTYHKRWGVECYHKSLKQNVSLAKSPTQTVITQTNHFFAALCGFVKLERLKMKTHLNHFALKSKLYLNALHSAFATLRALTPVQGSA